MLVALRRLSCGASLRLLVASIMTFAGGGIAGGGALVFLGCCLRAVCEECAVYGRSALWKKGGGPVCVMCA